MELELDVTETTATATAEKIHAFIREFIRGYLASQKDPNVA